MTPFNPTSSQPARAVQAWQILVGMAMNRQTVTYKGLSVLMYKKDAAGVLNRILGHIAFYCIEHELPALTSIVVGKKRGRPGSEIPLDSLAFDAEREKVYEYDWYNVYPPTEDEFSSAYEEYSQ